MTATVYILYSRTIRKFYVGFTTGTVSERMRKHLANHKGFTAKAKDWTIVHTEVYPDKSGAMKREIKQWKSIAQIRTLYGLTESSNPIITTVSVRHDNHPYPIN